MLTLLDLNGTRVVPEATPQSHLTLLDLSQAKILAQADDGPYTLADPQLARALVGHVTAAGKPVTKETAMRCASFMSGVKMLANDIAKMPVVLFERTMVKGQQHTAKAITEPLYPILKDVPNQWMTAFQLRWMQVFHLFFEGNFYIQKIEDATGRILGLMPLSPWHMCKRWDRKSGEPQLYFDYDDGTTKQTFSQDQIWWNSIMNCYGPDGIAILTFAKEALSVMMASDEAAGKNFANGLFSTGFITADKDAEVDPVEAQELVEKLATFYSSSRNAGKFTFMPYGAKFEKMSYTAEESQLLDSRKWNAEEVVRLLGGAPLLVKLGYGDKNSTYAASSAFLEEYFSTSLMPLTVNIEQSILRDLIATEDRGRFYAKHNADVSLRGSPKERADTNEVLIKSGQRMPNECRTTDDLDPVDGWDVFFFPANSGMYDPETGEKFLPSQKQVEQVPDGTSKPAATAPASPVASAAAERILRKEEKSGKIDPTFVTKVLGISAEQASDYAAKRPELSRDQAKALLISLATGEQS